METDLRADMTVERTRDASLAVRDGSTDRAVDRVADATDARGTSPRADASSDHSSDASDVNDRDGGPDAHRADAGRPTDAGLDGSGTPLRCHDGQYLNVARHICLPAHDLNADGRADLLAANGSDMQALISTGSSFVKMKWADGGFWGTAVSPTGNGAFAGDIAGSGFGAAVGFAGATNDFGGPGFVGVLYTGGPGFGTTADNYGEWFTYNFVGERATFIADVDGDGAADLLAVNNASVDVSVSTRFNFKYFVPWGGADLSPYKLFFVADADGDGLADLIAIGASSMTVSRSSGSGLSIPVTWRATTFSGAKGTFFADVDGDGRADGVRVESGGAWVSLSTGTEFAADLQWFTGSIAGETMSFVADADGDGRADFIAVNSTNVKVYLSTGAEFAAPVVWYSAPFIADNNITVAPAPSSSCAP